jgi:UDP-N-acetylglucosamine 4,6-dehydratase/5-epimerase
MFKNKSILITGGTGSFGQAFTKRILSDKYFKQIKKLVIYSRDELKQTKMSANIQKEKLKKVRFYIGDIRDEKRLSRALEGINIVIHAAALKQVPIAEANPFEFIKTNIVGANNLVEACFDNSINNVIALSTDKAVSPINLYGATKLCSDKIFTSANFVKGSRDIKFSVVRYGNVFASRGSVVPIFLDQIKSKKLNITHKDMTRFNINLEEAVDMVLWTMKNNIGGEIFVPKVPSYKITDLAEAIDPKCKLIFTGTRPGEKIYEELVSKADSINTFDILKYYSVVEKMHYDVIKYYEKKKFKKVPKNFEYNSSNNKYFLSINQLRDLINKYKKTQS